MNKMAKGDHEKAVEHAKALLDKGTGMDEIKQVTHLTEDEIAKVKNELIDRT